jgi:hypothetical protein
MGGLVCAPEPAFEQVAKLLRAGDRAHRLSIDPAAITGRHAVVRELMEEEEDGGNESTYGVSDDYYG